jgi:hypothetical protein
MQEHIIKVISLASATNKDKLGVKIIDSNSIETETRNLGSWKEK